MFEERASGSPPFYASPFDDTNDKNTDHDVHDTMDLSWSESELLLSPVLKLPVTPTYDDAQSMQQPTLTPPGPVALVRSTIDKHVAFSVSAGCFTYQMGVAAYMQEHFDLQGVQFTGASGGSWPATVLACGMDMEYVLQTIIDEAPKCCVGRLLGAYGVYDQGVRMVFDKLFKDCTDLPDQVRGKLAISVTRLAWMKGVAGLQVPYLKDEVISDFKNKDDIIDCVLASSLIPFALNGKPWVRYRDWICVDAGVTNVGGTRRFADELKKEFTNEIKVVMDHARAMKEEVQHQAHHGFELASDPYGLLGLTVQTSKALATEMQGEVLDSLTALRLALGTVAHETLMVDELMAEVKALAAAGSSPSSSSNGGGSSGGEATVVGMVPSLNMTAALRRYLAITRAVQGACGKVVSKVAHKVNERAVSVTDRLVSTTTAVGTAVVTAPIAIGGQMLSTTAALVGGAANLGINAASATLSATVTATTCAVNLPWAVMSGVTSSVFSALTGSNTHNTSNVPAPVELGYQSQWKEKEAAGVGAGGDMDGGDTTLSYEDHGGYDSDHDMSMHTWVEREGRKGAEADDDSGIASEAEVGYTTMVIEGELERTVEVVFEEEEDSDVCEDEEASLSVEQEGAPQSSAEGFHWRKKGGGIKRTAGGGLLLEITPWTWRKQPLHHYHLSSDILVMRRLFELGRQDAAAHHTQLEDFFGQ
jgi:hypothetical protein